MLKGGKQYKHYFFRFTSLMTKEPVKNMTTYDFSADYLLENIGNIFFIFRFIFIRQIFVN